MDRTVSIVIIVVVACVVVVIVVIAIAVAVVKRKLKRVNSQQGRGASSGRSHQANSTRSATYITTVEDVAVDDGQTGTAYSPRDRVQKM